MFKQFIEQAKMIYVQDIAQAKRKEAMLDEAYKYAKTSDNYSDLAQEYKKLSAVIKRIYGKSFFSIDQKILEKSQDCFNRSSNAPSYKFF